MIASVRSATARPRRGVARSTAPAGGFCESARDQRSGAGVSSPVLLPCLGADGGRAHRPTASAAASREPRTPHNRSSVPAATTCNSQAHTRMGPDRGDRDVCGVERQWDGARAHEERDGEAGHPGSSRQTPMTARADPAAWARSRGVPEWRASTSSQRQWSDGVVLARCTDSSTPDALAGPPKPGRAGTRRPRSRPQRPETRPP